MKKMLSAALILVGSWAQAAVPPAIGQTVLVEFREQNKWIVLGQDPTLTFRVLTGTVLGRLSDLNGTPLDTTHGPVEVSKNEVGQAIVIYSHYGYPQVADPDYIIFEVQNAQGDINRAMVRIDLILHPLVELFAEDPQLNPSAIPIGTAGVGPGERCLRPDRLQFRPVFD
jgi:hypothetical protein